MRLGYSKQFLRQYAKLPPSLRQKVDERILLWQQDPLSPQLRLHALKGKHKDYRSRDITGDVRVLFLQYENGAVFDTVGTDSQLYG